MKTRLLVFFLSTLLLPVAASAEPQQTDWVSVPWVEGLPRFAPLVRVGLEAPTMATVAAPEWIDGFDDGAMVVVLGEDDGEPARWLLRYNANGTRSMNDAGRILTPGRVVKMRLPLTEGASPDHELELRLESDRLDYRWTQIEKTLTPGQPMPPFRVADLGGTWIESKTLLDRWTVIDWWSTTCIPCVEAMPELNALVSQFEDQRVRFLAVAFDDAQTVRDFLTKRPFEFEQTVVVDDSAGVFGNTFPRTVIVDPEGIVRYDKTGYGSAKVFDEITDLLREGLADAPSGSR